MCWVKWYMKVLALLYGFQSVSIDSQSLTLLKYMGKIISLRDSCIERDVWGGSKSIFWGFCFWDVGLDPPNHLLQTHWDVCCW